MSAGHCRRPDDREPATEEHEMNSPRVRPSVALMGVAALAFAAASASAVAGPIVDKNLEAVLRTQVFEKRDKTDELTEEDLKKVYIVKEGKKKGIKDLTGIEKCVNLLEL